MELRTEDIEKCIASYKGFWYGHELGTRLLSQGCEYDLEDVGFADVGVDANLIGRLSMQRTESIE